MSDGRAPADREARVYDPRREARRQLTRVALPDDVEAHELDQDVRRSLLTLSRETAELVARHLVMTGRLLEDDPEQALVHARAAGALAGRVAVVREAAGLAAYRAGEWAEALSELRAARRMSGSAEHLPVLADCERALGRPERALAALDDRDVPSLDQATRVELVIVVAGARRDLGQQDAAVLLLQGPARATTAKRPWAARLWYAYADALLQADREDEARSWFEKAADVDTDGATDAAERLLELDGVLFDDDDVDDDPDEGGSEDVAQLQAAGRADREGSAAGSAAGERTAAEGTAGQNAAGDGTAGRSAADEAEVSLDELVAGMTPLDTGERTAPGTTDLQEVGRQQDADLPQRPQVGTDDTTSDDDDDAVVTDGRATRSDPTDRASAQSSWDDEPPATDSERGQDAGRTATAPSGPVSPFSDVLPAEPQAPVRPAAVPSVAFVAAEPAVEAGVPAEDDEEPRADA